MNSNPQTDAVLALMKASASYPDGLGSIETAETHISWVFFTERYAYKLKKPVRFEFLDFSTSELRHQACMEEVRLNRRLAADVYLAVLPISEMPDGSLALNGKGRAIDWVVQMRRLPADRALDVVLRQRSLQPCEAESIAAHLANFYARLLPKPVRCERFVRHLNHHIRANGEALAKLIRADRSIIRRVHSNQLRYLAVQTEEFQDRVSAGRIVDGHGDLRPEHIYVEKVPAVIDCIEFSDELREVDIADELSFLAMECERLGDGAVGDLVVKTYQRKCKDDIPPRLLAFYRAYRACVRAKVALFFNQQHATTESQQIVGQIREYLVLADRYANELGPPLLLIVGGLMGTGKSTLAAKLADIFDIDVLSTDYLRHQLLGASATPAAYGDGNYQPDLRERVYDELLRQAAELLETGRSVVLDGAFLTDCLRTRAYDVAHRRGAAFLHVSCSCPRQLSYARIQQRAEYGPSESEARTELYDLQARDFESPCADDPSITVDTTLTMSSQVDAVCAELRRQLFH
jgi:aminoglycoside phosphotransferase family enzyme/predicted kinase